MIFNFSVPVEKTNSDAFVNLKNSNGLFRTLQIGYSKHIPIAIRPDDVMNTISCIWSKYVILNAERFREFFVSHGGKKILQYDSTGTYSQDRLPEFMNGLITLIESDQSNDNLSWMGLETSVTTDIDRFIRSAAMLASQKEYYDYRVRLCCGFSRVELLGTDADWDAVESAIQAMTAVDEELEQWKSRLVNTIAGMRSGEEDFWQRCITNQVFGSGQCDYNGWILDFNPINEKGQWMSKMEDRDILDLTVDFNIQINDNGNEFEIKIEAGTTGVSVINNVLTPTNMFSIQELT